LLVAQQNGDGGWGYQSTNEQSFTEPTSWAMLACQGSGSAAPSVSRGTDFLLATQNEDGGWPNVFGMPSDIMTSRAVLALPDNAQTGATKSSGAEWLIRNELPEGGWGWCYGTTGFIDAAAFAITALHHAGRLTDQERYLAYVSRLRCADGGWCSHVATKMDVPQASQISVTPLGVIALQRLSSQLPSSDSIDGALALIERWILSGEINTPYSLTMTLWCLVEAGAKDQLVIGMGHELTRHLHHEVREGKRTWYIAMMVYVLGQALSRQH